jgi:RNA-binding protein 5/10
MNVNTRQRGFGKAYRVPWYYTEVVWALFILFLSFHHQSSTLRIHVHSLFLSLLYFKMAYNREWDQGKTASHVWNESGKGSVRQRDDEYHTEGKRRKFNNGVRSSSHCSLISLQYLQSYDGPGHEEPSFENYGQGRQTNYPQDQLHDDRSQRGFKKRLVPSEPSPHVIFLGLDQDFTEADLQTYLSNNGCSIETVTIIRDRSTGIAPICI